MPPKIRTAPRKEATQARSKATVDAILAATARVLVREGYDRASTNRIALAAGVSVGSLYQYFPSKEALVAALVERHIDEMSAVVHEAFARLRGAPLEVAARDLVRVMVRAHAVDPELHKVLFEQVPRVGSLERAIDIDRRVIGLARAYLAAYAGELRVKDLDRAAFVVVRAVEAITHGAVLERPDLLCDEALVDDVVDLVVRYLRP